MKISSSENKKDSGHSVTKTALFVRFLVKICFFPVSGKNGKIYFSWISLRTMVYITLSLGNLGAKFALLFHVYPEEYYGMIEERYIKKFHFF